ncbi:DUF1636 family protein [Marivivens aquimaris]|uniref:DUF1636 family protein n=1 Tax=Marivivens aquimaris TaxID=2774876 RepID=UPI0018812ED7|nr:DUF1636 domain-containing protein [Marivivens aquimaris]
MTSWITICEGCKTDDWAEKGIEVTDGAMLADKIEAAADGTGLKTRRVSCTMGCERSCNIIVQGKDKIGYSLGKFEPTVEAAEAIVEYAKMHSESESGQVPFRQWPLGVKGHFVSRHLPLPEAD